ncbi:glycine betaine/L-proline ABC transporter substrate-binding protein ProX [Pararhizobium mangrovi]|uniref:Glycine betaine/L-proline ABC transporter substrate-binding protein ProX n=1 Tax=Pararhizobium mangrovi TaxID=2590452 RepID=A0A506U0X0_9HYPH|nr:glycine betaine/L-proline ABC transporter substrate-binding protein ProX [Pararhizobium mangrovi]TPW27128.1 glycine betaine/L-proline ABC transporter substrate-binding protein ProX [Pararhizobium mangrovi]
MHSILRTTTMALAAASMAFAVPAGAAAKDNAKPGEGTTIKMARANWDTGWWQAEVYKQLFQKLGYDVSRVTTLQNAAFYQAVAQGDMDLWVNGWFPNQNPFEDNFNGRAQNIGYVAKGGALQGYLIDKKTADKYDIKYVSDLQKDKIAKLFDSTGDGKANMVSCPPGWECQNIIEYQMKHYGVADNVDLSTAGYAAAMADTLARFKNGKPVIFYTWTPNWTVGELKPGKDVVWLQVKETKLPKAQSDLADAAKVKNVTGCSDDPCMMGLPANDIRPVANTKFLKDNPAVKSLLQNVSIPVEDIFAQNAKMNNGADSPQDLEKQAKQWIGDHQDEVDGWLKQARSAAADNKS